MASMNVTIASTLAMSNMTMRVVAIDGPPDTDQAPANKAIRPGGCEFGRVLVGIQAPCW